MDSDSDENLNKDTGGPFISHIFVADGLRTDFKKIIDNFLELDSIRFECFTKLWEENHLDEILSYRPSIWEFAEFTEEAVKMATSFMVEGSKNSFQEAVAGLYLTYNVYRFQPIEGFAKIRITANEIDSLHMIRKTAKTQQAYDVLYILGRLLCSGAIQFRMEIEDYGLEKSYRKTFVDQVCMDEIPQRKGVLVKNGEEFTTLRETSALSRRYARMKALIQGKDLPDPNLRYGNEHLSNELAASLDRLIKKGVWKNVDDPNQQLLESRLKIRDRAMTSKITYPRVSGSKTDGEASVSKKQKKKKGGEMSLEHKLENILSEEEKQIDEE